NFWTRIGALNPDVLFLNLNPNLLIVIVIYLGGRLRLRLRLRLRVKIKSRGRFMGSPDLQLSTRIGAMNAFSERQIEDEGRARALPAVAHRAKAGPFTGFRFPLSRLRRWLRRGRPFPVSAFRFPLSAFPQIVCALFGSSAHYF